MLWRNWKDSKASLPKFHVQLPSDDDETRDSSNGRESALELSKGNPFGDGFPDPLCQLNLKDTSDFVREFPMSNKSRRAERRRSSVEHKRMDAPSTPGTPLFNFSVGKKSIPSKWDDAEKWLISSSYHESPAHVTKITRHKGDAFEEKLRASEEKVSSFHKEFHGATSEVFLKDKLTGNVEPGNLPHFLHCHRTREGFLCKSPLCDETKQLHAVGAGHRIDVGTTMTSLGNSTTSRWRHSPIKNSSPPRHNTPADRSGALVNFNNNIDISELDLRAHPFDSVVANWSSREEEEDDVSKSLRHFEADGERTKSCSTTESTLDFSIFCLSGQDSIGKQFHMWHGGMLQLSVRRIQLLPVPLDFELAKLVVEGDGLSNGLAIRMSLFASASRSFYSLLPPQTTTTLGVTTARIADITKLHSKPHLHRLQRTRVVTTILWGYITYPAYVIWHPKVPQHLCSLRLQAPLGAMGEPRP